MAGDKALKDGTYLSEGIYIEAERLEYGIKGYGLTQGNVYHTNLVYRDGQGNAEVIRGGVGRVVPGYSNISNPFDRVKFLLEVEAGKNISESKDRYEASKLYFDQTRHTYIKLDTLDVDPRVVWKEMVDSAKEIDKSIYYRAKLDHIGSLKSIGEGQYLLQHSAVVCHSVTGTVLSKNGFSIDDVVHKLHEVNPNINYDSLRGIKTDLFKDNVDRSFIINTIENLKDLKTKLFSQSDMPASDRTAEVQNDISGLIAKLDIDLQLDGQEIKTEVSGQYNSIEGIVQKELNMSSSDLQIRVDEFFKDMREDECSKVLGINTNKDLDEHRA